MGGKYLKLLLIAGVSLCLLVPVLFWLFYSWPSKLEVDFLDVGQGDAILIKAPGGQNILVDGGPDKTVIKRLGENLPWWDKTIDLMVLTHPHDDHVTGLIDVLKRYKVGRILYTGVSHTAPNYLAWLKTVRDQKTPLVIMDRPQTINLGAGVKLAVLYPASSLLDKTVSELNDSSLVIKLSHGENKILLTGDASENVERALLESGADLSAGVLKVAHHGSEFSSGEDFLAAVKPEMAVISVGKDNDFGHPNGRIVSRLKRLGAKIWRTDLDGTIRIVSDGRRLEMKK